ncbi:MAG: hypothetical protein JO165_07215, partial [Candidatus Eremiobacteraeota bacterium]|nr:hypothetical protein [Candidatus Eremiobacteraeota bacterium]
MNFEGIVDPLTRSALRLQWLEAALEPVSEYGRRCASAISPFQLGEEAQAQAQAREIVRTAQLLDASCIDAIRDALRYAPDATAAIARAGMGDVLSDANLLELQRFLDVAARIEALVDVEGLSLACNNTGSTYVARLLERGRAGKFGFYLADAFDARLADVRARAAQAQAEFDAVRGRLAARVAHALRRDEISASEFIVMRDGLDGSLPPEVRVVREAPTYLLCELELDEPSLQALERRDEAADAVAQTEEAARMVLSQAVREHARDLETVAQRLGDIDVLATRLRFAHNYDAV